jgi:acyl dehydratase
MSLPVRQFSPEALRQWIPGTAVAVDPDRAAAFADSLEAEASEPGGHALAIPMINVIPVYSCLFAAVDSVTPEDLRETIVHGSHDLHFFAPVRVGSTLRARARVTGVHATRAGTAVSVEIEVDDETGAMTSRQWATALVRSAITGLDTGTRCPAVDLSSSRSEGDKRSVERVSTVLRPDQPQRFSRASGDVNAVHLDDEVARRAGFDGVILHGLCTLGIASVAATASCCGGDPRRLRRLAGRFAAPAYPVGALTTGFQALASDRYAFETLTSEGVAVVRHGLAETS